ncbi:30S ribosomal protein S2 [bacterium CG06_land_8_20_14_3_00_33_50]|nr:MAG: 30S ribosomal protein S2 [bacterium CG06_land_8_20_14_3_00_33_50]PIW81241.1 MAG: 30S ribosomal protein S2 [bacterium CG_4_8_14_3_um_filter_33_28]PIY85600.1 MAG: 30S ribosomal protein S2 [bacterium CG_4_10_14_0_8_um_filter_33_57]
MSVEIKELLEAGAHFGHKSEKWNPKMKPFIFTKRGGIHIIDLTKTKEKLEQALDFVKKISEQGKVLIFVGTKKQAQEIIKTEAIRAGMPYVNERWLGGTFTNFQTIIKQLKKLITLREDKEKGEWDKFSKKEKSLKQKQLEKLEKSIGGLEKLRELPSALYVVDSTREHLAIKEAKKMNIPAIAIVDSNGDPNDVDYPIPANDDAIKVVKFITTKMADAILEVKPVKEEEKDFREEKTEEGEEVIKEDIKEIEEKLKEKIEEEEVEAKKKTKTTD